MSYFNISQATYDRLVEREANNEPQQKLDVADLLEAYESAVLLLQNACDRGDRTVPYEVFEFLYTDAGDPKVTLDQ